MLFPVQKNARKFTDTLKRRIEPSTASLADAYDMPLTPTPEQVPRAVPRLFSIDAIRSAAQTVQARC